MPARLAFDPAYVLDNETLNVEDFLCDVSMHLRRRDLKVLLKYIGLTELEIDNILYDCKVISGTERGMLMNRGTVVEQSRTINFLQQRKDAMHTWWEYAVGNKSSLPKTPQSRNGAAVTAEEYMEILQQQAVDSNTFKPLPQIVESKHNTSPKTQSLTSPSSLQKRTDAINIDADAVQSEKENEKLLQDQQNKENENNSLIKKVEFVEAGTSISPISSINNKNIQLNRGTPLGNIRDTAASRINRSAQTELVGEVYTPDKIAIHGTDETLEKLLRKLWRSLHACGLKRVVAELQKRWLIQVDLNQGRADMYPKMTLGTPAPPKTSFTYPPYKKIGHMAVMGSTMSLEAKQPSVFHIPEEFAHHSFTGDQYGVQNVSCKPRLHTAGSLIALDDQPITAFPSRKAWKLKTDSIRQRGASISIHLTIDDVLLPSEPSDLWGSSLHVKPQQIRDRVSRVFFTYSLRDTKALCRAVDRVEKIRGLVVEGAMKRIIGGSSNKNSVESDKGTSELVFQCRCMHSSTVEQLWLVYQSGQLKEYLQAGLVSRASLQFSNVDNLLLGVFIHEDEYRRCLGLLRRKPLPNTKSGRYYASGVPQSDAPATFEEITSLTSHNPLVTTYMNLPPAPQVFENGMLMKPSESMQKREQDLITPRLPQVKNLLQNVLQKELKTLSKRIANCERDWCEFVAGHFSVMLRCAKNIMKRRLLNSTNRSYSQKVTSLRVLKALQKAVKSSKAPAGVLLPPKGANIASVTSNHSSIALYPSNIAFASADFDIKNEDDDAVIKQRKKEEREFVRTFNRFSGIANQMNSCRNAAQDRIVSRLATNPTVATSNQLFIAKDLYIVLERWRNLCAPDFIFANDEAVLQLSQRILSNETMENSLSPDLQADFPGMIALLPVTFHVANQILAKLKDLLKAKDISEVKPPMYSVASPRGGHTPVHRYAPLWQSAA